MSSFNLNLLSHVSSTSNFLHHSAKRNRGLCLTVSEMKGLYAYIFLVFRLTVPSNQMQELCPANSAEWRKRASGFGCDSENNGTYHCIQAINGDTVQVCMFPEEIAKEEAGCPRVTFVNGRVFLARPFQACKKGATLCPRENHRIYYTDQLYEYLDCIPIPKEIPTEKPDFTTTSTVIPSRYADPGILRTISLTECGTNQTSDTVVLEVFIFLFLLLVIILIIRIHHSVIFEDLKKLKETIGYLSQTCLQKINRVSPKTDPGKSNETNIEEAEKLNHQPQTFQNEGTDQHVDNLVL